MNKRAFSHFWLTALLIITVGAVAYAEDLKWPREFKWPGGVAKVYQPQLETFEGTKLSARAATSVQLTTMTEPMYGAVWFDATVDTDRETRIVTVKKLTVPMVRFTDATEEQEKMFGAILEKQIKPDKLEISLDRLLAMLQEVKEAKNRKPEFNNTPPEILFVTEPTVLVKIDGNPVMRKVEDTTFSRVVNSGFFIVKTEDGTWYLKGGQYWYYASDLDDTWEPVQQAPPEIEAAAKAAFSNMGEEPALENEAVPDIVVTTGPMELIETGGDPKYTPIPGTQLQYISNSDSNVFFYEPDDELYVLIAGRWFKSPMEGGDWTFVPGKDLPEDFAKIPEDSPKANVLVSVPGTLAAQAAILDAEIPQIATVPLGETTFTVTFDGTPKFEPVEGTSLTYAVNSPIPVIKSENDYYACDNAVWYNSSSATGPWDVATSIPKDVSSIPPSSPIYNVSYVQVYDLTTNSITLGYTPGYVGSYVYDDALVYGTGYSYQPWIENSYYARPTTYGYDVSYNPSTDDWSWGYGYGAGFLGFGGWIAGSSWGNPWSGPSGYSPSYYPRWGGNHSNWSYNHNNIFLRPSNPNRPWNRPPYWRPDRPDGRPDEKPDGKPGGRPDWKPDRPSWRPERPPGWKPPERPEHLPDRPGTPGERPDRPGLPGERPDRPGTPGERPSLRPGERPDRPGTPGERPSLRPGERPDRPGTPGERPDRPELPGERPDRPELPGERPNRPGTPGERPDRPGLPGERPNRPGTPGERPSVRPEERPGRPGQPGERPTRPTTRPATRPQTRPGGEGGRPGVRPETRPETRPTRPGQEQAQARPGTVGARPPARAPETRPARRPSTETGNNVYTDRQGNVYQQTNRGWQQRNGTRPTAQPPTTTQRPTAQRPTTTQRPAAQRPTAQRPTRTAPSNLNRDAAARARGAQMERARTQRTNRPTSNISRPTTSRPTNTSRPNISRPSGGASRPNISRPSGGGARPSGGGGTRGGGGRRR